MLERKNEELKTENIATTSTLWIPSGTTPWRLSSAVKLLLKASKALDRVIIVLDQSAEESLETKTFSEYYWMIRDAYEAALAGMEVEEGLQVDLQVFCYPRYLDVSLLCQTYPAQRLYILDEEKTRISLPECLDNLEQEVIRPVADEAIIISHSSKESFEGIRPGSFDVVAVGGTFDRLHAGHKLMLASSLLLARCSVIIGLTDASMLASKRYADDICTYAERLETLMRYVRIFSAGAVGIEVVPLHDPYGPTVTTPAIDVLVVSEETLPGAEQINRIRSVKGMIELRIVPVEFVKLSSGERISSTMIRSHLSI